MTEFEGVLCSAKHHERHSSMRSSFTRIGKSVRLYVVSVSFELCLGCERFRTVCDLQKVSPLQLCNHGLRYDHSQNNSILVGHYRPISCFQYVRYIICSRSRYTSFEATSSPNDFMKAILWLTNVLRHCPDQPKTSDLPWHLYGFGYLDHCRIQLVST